MERVKIIVTGLVQGVFFRAYTKEKAKELNVYGWVRNNKNGSVEILAEGKKEDIERFISWCKIGSPYSKVENVFVEKQEYKGEFNKFEITY